MFRDSITMLVAFAVASFTLNPALEAQYSGPAAPQAQMSQYPPITQNQGTRDPGTQNGNQAPQGPGFDPNGTPDQQSNPQQDLAADQKHAVARLSIAQGDVNIKLGNGELTGAALNAPLLAQDRLQTSDGSRAEVELDAANLVRLAPNTDLGFADLEYHRYQLQLGAGTIIYRVLRQSDAQVEVDTPSVGFRPMSLGEFRLSVLDDGTTQITARSGQGEIFGPRGSQALPAGQTVLVRGNSGDPEFRSAPEIARDQFEDWSAHRDSDLLRSQSYRYVSQDVAGAADLDNYGQWVPSQYGQVWTPQSQPAGWSPYSTGQWSWDDYYGWNWVDSAPWGWAPYHYGRWFWNGGYGWSWWPGAIGASFWSPALVGFFGWGGFGIGLGIGGLGWCALAPFESFHRWWGQGWYGRGWGGRGFRPYNNFARNADIARTYRNAAYRGGAMTASYNAFGGPHQRFSPATRSQLTNASSFRGGQLPITPTRASYQFSNRAVAANPRLASASSRQFFQSSQFRSIPTAGGRPGTGSGVTSPNLNSPRSAHGIAPNIQNSYAGRGGYSGAANPSNGWQRFGDPGNGGALRQGFASGSEQSGWHRFGQPQQQGSTSSQLSGGRMNAAPAPNRNSGPAANTRSYTPTPGFSAPRNNTPSYNSPGYNRPNYNSPSYNRPSYSSPSYGTPHYNVPSYSAPHYSAPSAPRFSAPSGGSSSGGGHSVGSSGGGHSGGSSGGGGGHGGGGHHR